MFSSRLPGQLDANRVSRLLADLRRDGVAVADLTESNPTRAGFEYPLDLLAPLGDARGLSYRPAPLGLPEARAAVAADFARRGLAVDPAHIALTASTSEAYSLLFKLLCEPGDEVLIPRPSYPLFEHLTRLDAVRAVPYDLEYHGRWSIDLASVERGLSARSRALLLVSPNNPTGNVVLEEELDGLAALCGPRDIALIADEVFADYPLDLPAARVGGLTTRTDVLGFTLGGLSKTVGLPQAKLGWIVVSGGAALAPALARLEFACDTYLSVSTPVQVAAARLLEQGATVRLQIHERVKRNLARCRALVDDRPACRLLRVEGGWYGVIQVPSLMPEDDLVMALLAEDHVFVHPGYFFDFASESFLIVSLLTREETFARGVSRLLDRFRLDA